MIADSIFMSLIATGILFCIWGAWCNHQTYRDLTWAIGVIFAQEDWHRYKVLLDRNSYDQHMWDRIFLRDPWPRYDPELRDFLFRNSK
jgi:hypothetical protein